MARKTWSIQQIKGMRRDRHWSQEKLAEASGLSTRTIQRIEQGHKVDVASVKLLALAFDTDVDGLIGTGNKVKLMNPEKLHPEVFKVSVALAIVLVICMLVLAIFSPELGVKPWLELGIAVFGSMVGLNIIAQRTFGFEATKRFCENIFWQGPKSYQSLSKRTQLRIHMAVTLAIGLITPLLIFLLS